jgi:ferredoxin
MELRIDEDTCTGHGRCYSLVPELFDCDDFGHGVVRSGPPIPDMAGKARLAVQNCPERAIIFTESEPGGAE